MWGLYILMALLSASVVIKLAAPLQAEQALGRDRRLTLLAILALPLAALIIYHAIGRPDLRSAMAVFTDYQQLQERRNAALAKQPTIRLLSENGEDIGALVQLGQINYRLGRYEDAVPYLRKALALAERDGDWRERVIATVLVETLMQQSRDVVTDDARAVIAHIRRIHPQNPLARYFTGLDLAQQDRHEEAIAEWRSLLAEGGPSIYWKRRVREKMVESQRILRDRRALATGGAP